MYAGHCRDHRVLRVEPARDIFSDYMDRFYFADIWREQNPYTTR